MPSRTIASSLLTLLAGGALLPLLLHAQSESVPVPAAQPALPALNAQQQAGRGLFVQNCSYCHLPTKENNKSTEAGTAVGPLLDGLMSGPKPRPEAVVRGFILKGTPKMPGFQYSFEPKEMDQVIAYLKTL